MRIRDLAGTAIVLAALLGTLMAINPRVRDRLSQVVADFRGDEWSRSQGALSQVFRSTSAIVTSYAGDNTYLFVFFVVAVVLLIFMLRT